VATKKVVQELITKWKYQVDATQIKRTASAIKALKKNFTEVRKSSVSFGKGEFARIKRIKNGWMGLNTQVKNYRRNLERPARGGVGGGGRGKGTGKAGLGQSGAFLAGRLTGSSALTSALLGGGGLAATFGIGAAIKKAGERQQAEAAFTGILGGTKGGGGAKATEMLDKLNKFAVETPFNISDLRSLSRESLGGGFEMGEVIPQLAMLGDVTQGNIVHLRRMLTNMVEIKNIGKANLRDVRQFGRVGIPIYEALADTLGKSGAQIGDMITKGKIGLPEITGALKSLTSEGGRFFQSMKLQMATLLGQVSNLGDALIIMAENIGGPLLPLATKAVKGLKNVFTSIAPPLAMFAKGIAKVGETFLFFWDNSPGIRGLFKDVSISLGVMAALKFPFLKQFAILFLLMEDFGVFASNGKSLLGVFVDTFKSLTNMDFGDIFTGMKMEAFDGLKNFGEWLANTGPGKAMIAFFKLMGSIGSTTLDFLAGRSLSAPQGIVPAGAGGGGVGSIESNTHIQVGTAKEAAEVVETVGERTRENTKKLVKSFKG